MPLLEAQTTCLITASSVRAELIARSVNWKLIFIHVLQCRQGLIEHDDLDRHPMRTGLPLLSKGRILRFRREPDGRLLWQVCKLKLNLLQNEPYGAKRRFVMLAGPGQNLNCVPDFDLCRLLVEVAMPLADCI